MSAYPQALLDHFAQDVTTVCTCWRLTRVDGVVAGFTDHDLPLRVDGLLFEPESGFSASEARETLGMAVDTVDVEGALSSARIRDEDIAAGLYDGAKVETLLVNWRKPGDFAVVRTAAIGKITRSEERFVAELESLASRLDQPNGRSVRRTCNAELGDARCGVDLDRPGFRAVGTVEATQGAEKIVVSGLDGFEAGWFAFGALAWATGPRAGRSERVVDHRVVDGDIVLVLQPRVGPPVGAGDAFSIVAGCDKTFATCKAKFGNALNFHGFPHLPGNDAAYSYVGGSGNFDGGPIVP